MPDRTTIRPVEHSQDALAPVWRMGARGAWRTRRRGPGRRTVGTRMQTSRPGVPAPHRQERARGTQLPPDGGQLRRPTSTSRSRSWLARRSPLPCPLRSDLRLLGELGEALNPASLPGRPSPSRILFIGLVAAQARLTGSSTTTTRLPFLRLHRDRRLHSTRWNALACLFPGRHVSAGTAR